MSSSDSNYPIKFILDCFDTSINALVNAAFNTSIPVTYTPNNLNPSIVYEVDTRVLRDVFQIGSDGTDLNDYNSADLRYYVDMTRWPANYKLNVANGMADYVNSEDIEDDVPAITVPGLVNSIYITDSRTSPPEPYSRNRCLMKDVVVRDLAKQMFGTANAVDFFNNEKELVQDVEDQGKDLWLNNILYRLRYVDTSSNTEVMDTDPAGVKCLKNNSENSTYYDTINVEEGVTVEPGDSRYAPNTETNISNPTKMLFTQMLRYNGGRRRFETDSDAAPNASPFVNENTLDGPLQRQPLPFMEGDTISFKVQHRHGDNNITSKTLEDRTYYISLVARNNSTYLNTPNNHPLSDSSQTMVLL